MSKYPVGRHIHICQECGHPLGLKTPVWWWGRKLCCHPCKALYRARWWRDWRQKWFNRLFHTHESSGL